MKKVYYIPIAILLLLIVTNPSMKAFKEYIGRPQRIDERITRKSNFLIFSIYTDDQNGDDFNGVQGYHSKFVGVLGNFFRI